MSKTLFNHIPQISDSFLQAITTKLKEDHETFYKTNVDNAIAKLTGINEDNFYHDERMKKVDVALRIFEQEYKRIATENDLSEASLMTLARYVNHDELFENRFPFVSKTLNELSKGLLKSYNRKAFAQKVDSNSAMKSTDKKIVRGDKLSDKERKNHDFHSRRWLKRSIGGDMANKKLASEEISEEYTIKAGEDHTMVLKNGEPVKKFDKANHSIHHEKKAKQFASYMNQHMKAEEMDDREYYEMKRNQSKSKRLKRILDKKRDRKDVDEARLSPQDASDILRRHNAHGDFHALPSDSVEGLLGDAKKHGYRKSKNAPGSTGRMFHQHLTRLAKKVHEEKKNLDEVSMNIPLLIRLLEYAKEDAKNDVELHRIAEKIEALKGNLTMDDYSKIVEEIEDIVQIDELSRGLLGHYSRKIVDTGQTGERAKKDRRKGLELASRKRWPGQFGLPKPKVAAEEKKSLDEISQEVKSRYLEKAKKSERKHYDNRLDALFKNDEKTAKFHARKYKNRVVGIDRANEEQIDELSRDTVHSFVDKSFPKILKNNPNRVRNPRRRSYAMDLANKKLRGTAKVGVQENPGKSPKQMWNRKKKETAEKSTIVPTIEKAKKRSGVWREFKKGFKHGYHGTRNENLEEAKKKENIIHHDSYTSAIQHALEHTAHRGYEVDHDDFHNKVTHGQRKPSEGQTVSHSILLHKNGKPSRQALHIQVYNKGGDRKPYELNHYIS